LVEAHPTNGNRHAKSGQRVGWRWGVWLALAFACAAGLRNYRVDNDLGDWVPRLRARGPVKSYVVVGFERGTIDDRSLAERLCSLSVVAFCVSEHTFESGGRLMGMTPDAFVTSLDGTYAGVFLFPQADVDDARFVGAIRAAIEGTLGGRSEDVNLAGPAVFHMALNDASQRRLPQIMVLILLVGGVLMWAVTGSAATACAAMAAITLSQIVLVGALSWLRVPMDVSVSMVPPLMMGFGFSYAAHRALRTDVGGVLALCVVTTALGFGMFIFADAPPVRTFAVTSVVGLAGVWLAVMTLVPGPHPRGDCTAAPAESPRLQRIIRWTLARDPRVVAGIATVLTLLAAGSVRYQRVETNPLNYFSPDERVVRDFTILNERLTGMLSSQWSVSGDATPAPLLSHVQSVRKIIDMTPIFADGRRHFWCLADNDALGELIRLDGALRNWAREAQADIKWEGVAAQLGEISRIIEKIAVVSLPAMGLVAAVAVGWLSRSVVFGMISLWVNLLPVGVLMLIAAVMRWTLDLPSLMIGAVAVGMAIDDTLHIVSEQRQTGSVARAVVVCLRPCAGSSVVTAACFLCFAISTFGPTRQFGILLALASLAALLADLVLLPALCALVKRGDRTEKRGAAKGEEAAGYS